MKTTLIYTQLIDFEWWLSLSHSQNNRRSNAACWIRLWICLYNTPRHIALQKTRIIAAYLKIEKIFQMPLRSSEPTFGTFIGTPELSASFASPYYDFSAVWARKFCCFRFWWNRFVTWCACGYSDCRGCCFSHVLSLFLLGCYRLQWLLIFAMLLWLLVVKLRFLVDALCL